MATAQQHPYISEVEYFELDANSDIRYEYANGSMFAMADGSPEHTYITTYTSFALIRELGVDECRVSTVEQRVKVERAHSRYPDITITCDEAIYHTDESGVDFLVNPTFLLEMLSKSTYKTDIYDKVREYQFIASLKAYIIISQDEPYIQIYQRQQNNQWLHNHCIRLRRKYHY